MTTSNSSPRDYGLPHDEWRPYQRQVVDRLINKPEGSITILSAPTGSGKTGLARGVASKLSVTALVRTKMLQQNNYADMYNFSVLFGRANYPCVHPGQIEPDAGADQCLYEMEMEDCEYVNSCPYVIKKREVQRSRVRCLNYAYFLTSSWTKKQKYVTDYLFMDECHLLSDETVEWVGVTVRDSDRLRWGLPGFPSCYQSSKESIDKVLSWMEQAIGILELKIDDLKDSKSNGAQANKSKAERFASKIRTSCTAIHRQPQDWYVRAGERALEYMGKPRPGLAIKPLTARYHFPKLFLEGYPRIAMMSATIGNPEFFAEELGIENYEFEHVPNQWLPENRPVHVLPCPTIGHKSPETHYVKQAEIITGSLQSLPADWSGIIHVTSWKQASDLAQRLQKAGFDSNRLHVPQRGRGTNEQMTDWDRVKLSKAGMIILTPSMSEGVDLLNERICIVAKIPFPSIAPGSYDFERMIYSNNMYRLRTAWGLEQRCGRTRRGRTEDYDTSFEKRGYVGICDGSFQKMGIKKYCSGDFVDSLVYD